MSKNFSLLVLPAPQSVKEALKRFTFPIDFCQGKYKSLTFTFHRGQVRVFHGQQDLRDFSFVWLTSSWNARDLAYAMSLYLEATKTPHSPVEKTVSKITDSMVFTLAGLPLPDTLFVRLSEVPKKLDLIRQVCGYPLIIKDAKGAQGKHSQYVSSEDELLAKIPLLPRNRRFIFQRFIPNEYDWGIMVVNGVVVAGEKSYPSSGEFRNNAINGAREVFIDVNLIPAHLKTMAIKASQVLGLAWSRADIVIHQETGEPYLLEVNRYPGITSGSDEVAGAYAFLSSHITPQ